MAARWSGAPPRSRAAFLLLAPAFLLLIFCLVVPLCATLWLSLQPNPLVRFEGPGLQNYGYVLSRPYYVGVALRTLRLAAECTLISLLLGFPAALALRAETPRLSANVTLLMTLPVLAGPLVVVLGWMILLSNGGPLLAPLEGWIGRPRLLGSEAGIVIGVVHFVLPFVVLSLTSVVRAIPESLLEAARSLGASRWAQFRLILLPLATPGLLAAAIIALSLSMSSFIAPHYLGGPADLTLTTLVSQFVLATFNGQMAAVISMLLLVLMTALIGAMTLGTARWIRA